MCDEYTRESVALKLDGSITSEDVIDSLHEPFAMRGVPGHIRGNNGPDFIAQPLRRGLRQASVPTSCIQLGSPLENGYAKSFHGRLRNEFLGKRAPPHRFRGVGGGDKGPISPRGDAPPHPLDRFGISPGARLLLATDPDRLRVRLLADVGPQRVVVNLAPQKNSHLRSFIHAKCTCRLG